MKLGVVVITILFLYNDLVTEATTGPCIPCAWKTLLRVFLRISGENVLLALVAWIKTSLWAGLVSVFTGVLGLLFDSLFHDLGPLLLGSL